MSAIDDIIKQKIEEFEKKINYRFKNRDYIQIALTHSSFANEHRAYKYNERLEFLGDSVLGLVVTDYLFNKRKDLPEGKLTKLRANVVCEESLSIVARSLNLGDYLFLGKGEKISGGRDRDSLLADAVEAVIAALYLDGGFEVSKNFIMKYLGDIILNTSHGNISKDYKTILQEIIQSKNEKLIYRLIEEKGPDHNKEFLVEVSNDFKVLGKGRGKNKKEAEKKAAKDALSAMGEI